MWILLHAFEVIGKQGFKETITYLNIQQLESSGIWIQDLGISSDFS